MTKSKFKYLYLFKYEINSRVKERLNYMNYLIFLIKERNLINYVLPLFINDLVTLCDQIFNPVPEELREIKKNICLHF